MKNLMRYLILSSVGGSIYMLLEVLFSGGTHWTMGVLGGICFVGIGLIDVCSDSPLYTKMFLGATLITLLELLTGIFLNGILHLQIWDYSQLPFNLFGQICLSFSCLWFWLCLPAILLNQWLYRLLFKEQ